MFSILTACFVALAAQMNPHDINVYNLSEEIKSETDNAYVIDVTSEDYGVLHPNGSYEDIYIVDKDCLIDLIIAGGY